MAVKKRAISEKDKLKRRDHILKTAWQLYTKNEGRLPTVSVIARKAGLSKGSVYLYFQTKNEIFLSLYMHHLTRWHESVIKDLEDYPGKISVAEYAGRSSRYLVDNPLVLRLGSMATSLLEDGVEQELILDFKIRLAQLLENRSRLTARLFPGLSSDQWVKVHLRIYALIFGLWQMFYSPKKVQILLREARLNVFEADFSQTVVESVATFINGALKAR